MNRYVYVRAGARCMAVGFAIVAAAHGAYAGITWYRYGDASANVTFRALPPDQFAAFDEPGYVKIAWTIRADPIDATESIFRTETRAVATDPFARSRFRRYWFFLSPGIIVIRWRFSDR